MNRQKVFDRVTTFLFLQAERCVDEDDVCLYRKGHGATEMRCGIGALIADGGPFSCKWNVCELTRLHCKWLPAYFGQVDHAGDIQFLANLQGVHDTENSPSTWPYSFKTLANKYGLTCSW